MSLLESTPPEVITQIFKSSSDFVDALSLASTCKYLHSVWTSACSEIIWEVGERSILAFNHAVIAVRTTTLVFEAQKHGLFPPPLSPSASSALTRKPRLDELKEVLNLQHLVLCVEHIFTIQSNREKKFWGESAMNETRKLSLSWKQNFHTAIYRVLIMGACLAGEHQESFLAVKLEGWTHFLNEFCGRAQNDTEFYDRLPETLPISNEDVDTLRKFPVCDFEDHERMEPSSVPFVDWLLLELRDAYTVSNTLTQESYMQREVGRFLLPFTLLCDSKLHLIVNAGGKPGYTRPPSNRHQSDWVARRKARRFYIVLPGIFQCEEIQMASMLEDVEPTLPVARQVPVGNPGPSLPDPVTLLDELFDLPGLSDRRGGESAPQHPLQLFECLLRRGFKLRFADETFGPIEQAWNQLKHDSNKFSRVGEYSETEGEAFDDLLDDVGTLILQSYGRYNKYFF